LSRRIILRRVGYFEEETL
jgi:hypothetical protein